jgi:hypothetical protein
VVLKNSSWKLDKSYVQKSKNKLRQLLEETKVKLFGTKRGKTKYESYFTIVSISNVNDNTHDNINNL